MLARCGFAAAAFLLAAMPAMAQDEPRVDTGDAAWMMTSTALVLMMTVPGVALFYAGMVRKKNVLATMMQSFFICGLVSVLWMVAGYSIAFGDGGAYVGDFSRVLLTGIAANWDKPFTVGSAAPAGTVPESIFITFQMTFAVITAALITGAVAERMKFSALVVFISMWTLLIYAPIAHWVWHPDGWLAAHGALDFAGGTVVHINAGVAGLVASIVLGRRIGYGSDNMSPFDLGLAVAGAALLWVGWFGFNAGSAGSSGGGRAGMAMLVTQIAAAAAVLSWTCAEWLMKGKPSVLGAISGAVAGLVAITPAAGFVLPGAALVIGLAAGVAGMWGATALKHRLGYDDSLDAFGVHGICGILGALLVGLLAHGPLSATEAAPQGSPGSVAQLVIQVYAVAATAAFTAVGTWVLLMVTKAAIGLRVSEEEEREGLDVTLHGERLG